MSLRVDRRVLGAALAKIRPVVRGSSPVEILRSVLLTSRPDASTLTITGTDLRLTVSVEIVCETGTEALEALVDPGRLADLCSSEWAEGLELGMGEDGRLVIKGETQTRLACLPVEDFPVVSEAPEEGWVGLSPEVVEAMGRAVSWAVGEHERRHVPTLAKYVWMFGAEGEGRVGIFGGGEHASLVRYLSGPEIDVFGIGRECAALVAGIGKGETVEMSSSGTRHFFRGAGWRVSEAKGETDGADPRRWLSDPRLRGDGMRPLPSMGNLLRVLDAMPRKVAGIEQRVMLEVKPTSPSGSRCYITSHDVAWSGEIPADLPPYRTYMAEDLVGMLKELDRIAGTEHTVKVGLFRNYNLRFEIEGEAVAFLSGVVQ